MKIILRNWQYGKDEIDIVAREQKCLVFVEVKTRSEKNLRGGLADVDKRKRKAQLRAIRAYLKSLEYVPAEYRFDVVEVRVCESDGKMSAVHHKAIPLHK